MQHLPNNLNEFLIFPWYFIGTLTNNGHNFSTKHKLRHCKNNNEIASIAVHKRLL